uniref:Major facilitator superfamily (MFS) profile domain-containing protein n=1 Tax=Leptocylindrus danicus TaxID=163516 RepID=A0A7S2NSZ2_9STRA|mmetsp:Transcript_11160/g.16918  ORF Transcript_11160/g.16918 Transcript_11160/m.16918 type:complete len:543 (+) Transcript_11160:593-2221(+)|eukprot:CAMPEP_0116004430 /NCGR_PEP_ID=MMETSP0321-20121206/597_1 /TAXON_ID=163516 /ORGANISM="Leptocylindrus danicus var. danicus, Strain B650" /LENGTH=542 /DNA_ID=CAMNT_0003472729 /DNA_START=585 /DNA_END=2213 /DNA_ORIENTATION=+
MSSVAHNSRARSTVEAKPLLSIKNPASSEDIGVARCLPPEIENAGDNNNFSNNAHKSRQLQHQQYGRLISALSNLSTQYNLGSIAPALLLFDPKDAYNPPGGPAYPCSKEIDSLLKGVVFVGAILGQCMMGIIGDTIGLDKAMILTNMLTVIGVIGCTVAPLASRNDEDGNDAVDATYVYFVLICSRAVLGVGAGGIYPVASAMSAEIADCEAEVKGSVTTTDNRAKEVGNGLFWQTPGSMLPYFVSLILFVLFGKEHNGRDHLLATNLQYMILVGFGILPSLAVLILTAFQLNASKEARETFRESASAKSLGNESIIKASLHDPLNQMRLIGTGASWFLYDIIYYGAAFNLPQVLASVFGDDTDLVTSSWRNLFVTSMGLPGVMHALRLFDVMGTKSLQGYGFCSLGVNCLALALCDAMDAGPKIMFTFCCCLIFTLNWAINVSTYVMPMESYPREVRSTFHGFSSGCGKVGGFIGGFFFSILYDRSVTLTFLVCALLSFIGVWVTWRYVEPFDDGVFSLKKRGDVVLYDQNVRRSEVMNN